MRRLTAYLLCVCFGLMGSGALKHVHNLAHAQDAGASLASARDLAPAAPANPGAPNSDHERDCPLHMLLGASLLAPAAADATPTASVAVESLIARTSEPVDSRLPARLDCRGPPTC